MIIRYIVAWSMAFISLILLFGALNVLAYITGTPLYTFGVSAVVSIAVSILHRNFSRRKRWAYRLAGIVFSVAAVLPIPID